jgi:hypothetical protein
LKDGVSVRKVDDALAVGAMGPVAGIFHCGPPTAGHIAAMRGQLKQLAAAYPSGIGLVFVIAETSGVPPVEVRDAATRMFQEAGSSLKLCAAILEGSGFAAAAKRSVFTLVSSSVFGTVKLKVFGAVPEGCLWLATESARAGIGIQGGAELRALVDRMRSCFSETTAQTPERAMPSAARSPPTTSRGAGAAVTPPARAPAPSRDRASSPSMDRGGNTPRDRASSPSLERFSKELPTRAAATEPRPDPERAISGTSAPERSPPTPSPVVRSRLSPGEKVDRYRILSVLGEGGMGTVYAARDTRLDRDVALKVVRVGENEDPGSHDQATARLLREARSAAALQLPSAVTVYDAGESEGVTFIVMELVAGRTLRTFVGDATVPLVRRIGWLREIARALAAAHEAGLVHRDIKPENVMIRADGAVKVLDFGIARRMTAGIDPNAPTAYRADVITREGFAVGSPLYMAPEQMRGEAVDGRADQFAWGIVAYELLTSRWPWRTRGDAINVVAAILTEPPLPMTDVPDLPPPLAEAVLRALSKSPADRAPLMNDVTAVLDSVLGAA